MNSLDSQISKWKSLLGTLCFTLLSSLYLFASDSPQWLGPNRDGVYPEKGLLKKWPKNGPKMMWYVRGIGNGYSSPVVAKGKVYVTGEFRGKERMTAFDLKGKQLWQTEYGNGWSGRFEGARTTPNVVKNRIYAISGAGEVVCLDALRGKLLWKVNALELFEGQTGNWGTAESPLVFDNKVIFTPGGSQTTVVALRCKDGSLAWKSPSLHDKSAYVSPLLIQRGGKKQILTVTQTYIIGIDAQRGSLLWKVNYRKYRKSHYRWPINTNTPLYRNGHIFVTSGYNHGGIMLELSKTGTSAKVLGLAPDLDTHHGGVVTINGYIYGSNWINNGKGNWVCIDWRNGKKKYEVNWGSKGTIISADGMLYCYEERRGTLGLVKATPKGFKVISSFRIRKGSKQHWSHPVISDGRLYLRRGKGLMVYFIKAK